MERRRDGVPENILSGDTLNHPKLRWIGLLDGFVEEMVLC